jgi:DNA-binding response OmpR family regulator
MKRSILVVDDEQNIRELCNDLLEEEGYKVTLAKDGFDALEKMDAENFELFLVDMIMPGMDGLELLQRIRKRQPLAVVIITTGFSSIEGAVKAVHAGAFQYLSKPLHADELIETVRKGVTYSQKLYGPLQDAFYAPQTKDEKMISKGISKLIFHGFPEDIKDEIMDIGHIRKFDKGDTIVTEKSQIKHFLLINSGEASVWAEEVSIDYLRSGDSWGEEEFLLENSCFTSLRAETHVEICYFIKDELMALLKDKGEMFQKKAIENLTNSVYYKWRKSIQRIIMLKMVSG